MFEKLELVYYYIIRGNKILHRTEIDPRRCSTKFC